jgi:hypothetical protein
MVIVLRRSPKDPPNQFHVELNGPIIVIDTVLLLFDVGKLGVTVARYMLQ